MGKSCTHCVHISQMERGRSEANPLTPQAGTILDAKWLWLSCQLKNYGGDGLKKGSTDFLVKTRT